MNGGDLIVGKHFQRHEGIAQMPVGARAVEDGVADVGARWAAPAASTLRLIGLFHAKRPAVLWGDCIIEATALAPVRLCAVCTLRHDLFLYGHMPLTDMLRAGVATRVVPRVAACRVTIRRVARARAARR